MVGDIPVVVYHDPENFTTSVFRRESDGEVITFSPLAKGCFTTDSKGDSWNLLTGSGPEGRWLTPVPHLNVYWFAWVGFYPDAEIHEQ